MRCLFILMCCCIIFSCNANQKITEKKEGVNSNSNCPEDGICSFEVLHDKALTLLHDGIGELYPEISDGKNIILKFEYKRNEIPNTMDGHYSELIYAELNPNNIALDVEDSQLQNVNLLFARFCFCKGQTGYYKVEKGKLSITKEGYSYRFNLEFKIDEVPQIITSVHQLFDFKK